MVAREQKPILQLRVALTARDYEQLRGLYKAALDRLLAHGATLVHPPVVTPWGDHNARLQDPSGMQITLFQEPAQPGEQFR